MKLFEQSISWPRFPRILLCLCCCLCLLFGCGEAPNGSKTAQTPALFAQAMREGFNPTREEVISLEIGGATIEVECAGAGLGMNLGLMHRTSLGPDEGMWFEFPDEDFRGFWMKNTRIPLSIAYIDSKGRIGNIEHMVPYDESSVHSRYRAKYALEMNQGWFRKKGIKPGDSIRIGDKKPNPNHGDR